MKVAGKGTFELFNVWSPRPDWVLEAPGLRITGTAFGPVLPGPTTLTVAYVDEPKGYTYRAITSSVTVLRVDVARVQVEGSFFVEDLAVDIALDAALVT